MSRFETVVRVVTACSTGHDPPRVSAEAGSGEWTIRISDQVVVYKGKSLDEACESLLKNWSAAAGARVLELERMQEWLRDAYVAQ